MGYLAILLSALASFIIGMLWYGKIFCKLWMRLEGFSKEHIAKEKNKNMGVVFITAFIVSALTAYILEWLMNALKVSSMRGALFLGFLIWLGFYVTTLSGTVMWQGKPFKLFILNIAYWLVNLLAISAILFYF